MSYACKGSTHETLLDSTCNSEVCILKGGCHSLKGAALHISSAQVYTVHKRINVSCPKAHNCKLHVICSNIPFNDVY